MLRELDEHSVHEFLRKMEMESNKVNVVQL